MAIRLYLANAAAPYTPATIRGTWTQTSATIGKLSLAKAGANATSNTIGTVSSSAVMGGRWVSDPFIAAGTLAGTVSFAYGAFLDSTVSATAGCKVHIYVTTGDSDTVRGTVLANFSVGDVWTTTATGRGTASATNLTSLAVSVGDRLVVEIGATVTNFSSSRSITVEYGATGATDLVVANTAVTTNPGWFEFSGADALFSAVTFGTIASVSNDGAAKAASYTQTVPASTASGDLLALISGNCYADHFTAVTGYTLLQDVMDATLSDVCGAAWWKTAGASEGSFTVAEVGSINTTTIGGSLLRYLGASSIRDSQGVAATSAVTTSPAPPALTGVLATDLVIHAYVYGDNASQGASIKDAALVTPPGWTQRANVMIACNVASQFNLGILICDRLGGTDLPTITAARAGGWTVLSLALVPTAAAATPLPPRMLRGARIAPITAANR